MRRLGWGPPEKDPRKRAPRRRPTSTLWHNLGGAVERAVARRRECLAAAITTDASGTQPALSVPAAPPPRRDIRARTGRIAERTRRRHAAIHALLAKGNGIRAIAAELGLAATLSAGSPAPPIRKSCLSTTAPGGGAAWMLKRQMYSRANPDLLRRRILLTN